MRLVYKVSLISLFCFVLLPITLHAEVIGYLKLEGIQGNVTTAPYEGCIEIQGFGQGITNVGTGADFKDIRVTKLIDKTSPFLYLKVAGNTLTANAEIHLVSTTGENYFSLILTNLFLTSVVPSVGSIAATEMLSINPETIRWIAKSPGDPDIEGGWNLNTNTAL